jgi:hypothetical protein
MRLSSPLNKYSNDKKLQLQLFFCKTIFFLYLLKRTYIILCFQIFIDFFKLINFYEEGSKATAVISSVIRE